MCPQVLHQEIDASGLLGVGDIREKDSVEELDFLCEEVFNLIKHVQRGGRTQDDAEMLPQG